MCDVVSVPLAEGQSGAAVPGRSLYGSRWTARGGQAANRIGGIAVARSGAAANRSRGIAAREKAVGREERQRKGVCLSVDLVIHNYKLFRPSNGGGAVAALSTASFRRPAHPGV